MKEASLFPGVAPKLIFKWCMNIEIHLQYQIQEYQEENLN